MLQQVGELGQLELSLHVTCQPRRRRPDWAFSEHDDLSQGCKRMRMRPSWKLQGIVSLKIPRPTQIQRVEKQTPLLDGWSCEGYVAILNLRGLE